MSESKTERIFEKIMNFQEMEKDDNFIIEYQTTTDEEIKKALKEASKNNKGGVGKPEHIIRHKNYPDLLILTEGKKDITKHVSNDMSSPVDYAVDGIKNYCEKTSKFFDVIGIAFSGSIENEMRISYFFQPKNGVFTSIDTNEISLKNIIQNYYTKSEIRFSQDYANLQQYLSSLNNQLHGNKILEMERSFFISAVLISLDDKNFRENYLNYEDNLSVFLFESVKQILIEKNVETTQVEKLMNHLIFIKNSSF